MHRIRTYACDDECWIDLDRTLTCFHGPMSVFEKKKSDCPATLLDCPWEQFVNFVGMVAFFELDGKIEVVLIVGIAGNVVAVVDVVVVGDVLVLVRVEVVVVNGEIAVLSLLLASGGTMEGDILEETSALTIAPAPNLFIIVSLPRSPMYRRVWLWPTLRQIHVFWGLVIFLEILFE